ncbi:MAG: hypothetical protein WBF20_09015 [Trebonia sp.]|uniref:hypothetical protein n=1 Tax=Trebonia sp. TaxID=2767075 RepID=UPI003C764DC9
MITARRRAGLAAALGVVALAVLGYAAFEFSGQVTAPRAASSPVSHQQAAAKPSATQPSATPAPVAVTTAVTATPKATVTPRAQTLVPVSAVAFGPQGTADGDNPQIAARVLTDPAMGWVSQWYATPSFGDLKQGTGLLLDLGRTVTVTTVTLNLGSPPGTALELRLGAAPDLTALPVVTTATATRDQLSLPLASPAKARYVLLWFTRLPPDDAGTYQLFVHQVAIQGHP